MSRRSRAEVGSMESRITSLINVLRNSGGPVEFDLAGRLWRCQKQRQERRDGLRDRVDRPCRSVACEHCRRWRGRSWRDRAAEMMVDADNDHSSMVTVMLERAGDWHSVRDVVLGFRVALRNLRDRQARADWRWRRVSAVGMVELDMLAVDEIALLPPGRRAVIEALPIRSHGEHLVLIAHLHLAVSHPGIPRHVVEAAFRQQWGGAGRVDVRGFRDDAEAADNAAGIVAYASKFKMTATFDGGIETPVPVVWQAEFWTWLHGLGAGIAPLRVRMSAMQNRNSKAACKRVLDAEIEPMPFSVGSWNGEWNLVSPIY
jgi:hypothetical protein